MDITQMIGIINFSLQLLKPATQEILRNYEE